MHIAAPAKLSNIIAKQIRLKHLNQGIQHTKTRNKYRNYKLKEHYQTPSPTAGQVVMYSNPQGNQFIFKKSHFDAADFPDPTQLYLQLLELHKDINQGIYELWLQWKSLATREFFPLHRKLLLWSTIGLWSLALILCMGSRLIGPLGQYEEQAEWVIITTIVAVILVNIGVFVKNMTAKYSCFEYDNEVVALIARKIISVEDRLNGLGMEVICDREITWICFRIIHRQLKHIYKKQQMMKKGQGSLHPK